MCPNRLASAGLFVVQGVAIRRICNFFLLRRGRVAICGTRWVLEQRLCRARSNSWIHRCASRAVADINFKHQGCLENMLLVELVVLYLCTLFQLIGLD